VNVTTTARLETINDTAHWAPVIRWHTLAESEVRTSTLAVTPSK
jgi:hypothetical protein